MKIKENYFFTYSIARRRRRLSNRHMYMFSRHRKLDFCKIISFISGLKCLQNYDNLQKNEKLKKIVTNFRCFHGFSCYKRSNDSHCRTAARKFSVLPKVLELAYFVVYFKICDFTFQNINDNCSNYITFVLELAYIF